MPAWTAAAGNPPQGSHAGASWEVPTQLIPLQGAGLAALHLLPQGDFWKYHWAIVMCSQRIPSHLCVSHQPKLQVHVPYTATHSYRSRQRNWVGKGAHGTMHLPGCSLVLGRAAGSVTPSALTACSVPRSPSSTAEGTTGPISTRIWHRTLLLLYKCNLSNSTVILSSENPKGVKWDHSHFLIACQSQGKTAKLCLLGTQMINI